MNSESKALFDLIKSALTGEKAAFSSEINLEKIIKIARLHQIAPIIFYGLKNSGLKTPYDDILFEITSQHIIIEQQQLGIIEEIKTAFTKNNIDFAFLKGSRLKNIYPKSEMRVMGDIDVLIKPEQYSKIKNLLLQKNYEENFKWNYEYHWRKNGINIEFHKRLYSSNDNKIYVYFDNIWQKLAPQKDNKNFFELSIEDEYIYIFLHLLKHYCAGGIGMRQFMDLYTYRLKYTKINEKYVELILKQFGFLEFYNNVMETINYWFAGGIENEITKIITQKVLTSCLFGTSKSKEMLVISRDIKRSGNAKKAKIKAVLFTIFPSVSDVILRYPILKKASWILPIVWIIRWIGAIFNPEKIKNNVKRFKKYNEKTIAEYDDQLKKVGL